MTHWRLLPALGRDTFEAVEWSGRKIRNPKFTGRVLDIPNSSFPIPVSPLVWDG
jgi:hypothetical protein